MTACNQLIQQHAQRKDVRLRVDRFAARLLRRHVGDRAENHPGLGDGAGHTGHACAHGIGSKTR